MLKNGWGAGIDAKKLSSWMLDEESRWTSGGFKYAVACRRSADLKLRCEGAAQVNNASREEQTRRTGGRSYPQGARMTMTPEAAHATDANACVIHGKRHELSIKPLKSA